MSPRMRVLAVLVALLVVGCGGHATPAGSNGGDTGTSPGASVDAGGPGDTDNGGVNGGQGGLATINPSTAPSADVTVQLAEAGSAVAAGFYAADDEDISPDSVSYYEAENLSVLINPPAIGHDPLAQASAPDGPEFYFGPALGVIVTRGLGSDLVNIAQIYQRSGLRFLALQSSGIGTISALADKRLSVLGAGRDYDVLAALKGVGLTKSDVHLDRAPFDPTMLAGGAVDAAEVTIADEYAQILETDDPDTGSLYTPNSLTLLDVTAGSAPTLQEGIYARASWLADPANVDIAVRFLRATFRGWTYCRDNFEDCVRLVADSDGSEASTQHQRWVLNESQALIWPSPASIGTLSASDWAADAQAALDAGLIRNPVSADASRTDLAQSAQQSMTGVDLIGANYEKGTVQITPGGIDLSSP